MRCKLGEIIFTIQTITSWGMSITWPSRLKTSFQSFPQLSSLFFFCFVIKWFFILHGKAITAERNRAHSNRAREEHWGIMGSIGTRVRGPSLHIKTNAVNLIWNFDEMATIFFPSDALDRPSSASSGFRYLCPLSTDPVLSSHSITEILISIHHHPRFLDQ